MNAKDSAGNYSVQDADPSTGRYHVDSITGNVVIDDLKIADLFQKAQTTGGQGLTSAERTLINSALQSSYGVQHINDTIFGDDGTPAGGDDVLFGGSGNDILQGEAGNDFLDGGEGDDFIRGDWTHEDRGHDTLLGGAGRDSVSGAYGMDWIDGGANGDLLAGGASMDFLFGGSGNDHIFGDNDPEGQNGWTIAVTDTSAPNPHNQIALQKTITYNNVLMGLPPEADQHGDVIDGGAGDDYIFGDGGDDTLFGEADNDSLLRAGRQNQYNHNTTTGRYPVSFLALTWSGFSSEHRCRSGLTDGGRRPLGVAGGTLMDRQINHVCSDRSLFPRYSCVEHVVCNSSLACTT